MHDDKLLHYMRGTPHVWSLHTSYIVTFPMPIAKKLPIVIFFFGASSLAGSNIIVLLYIIPQRCQNRLEVGWQDPGHPGCLLDKSQFLVCKCCSVMMAIKTDGLT